MNVPVRIMIAALALAFAGRSEAQRLPVRYAPPALRYTSAPSSGTALKVGGSLPARLSWRGSDVALASAFTASLLIDAGQTRGLARAGWDGFRESNPILGPTPSVARINVYTALSGLAVLGVAELAPTKVRPWVLAAALALEVVTISRSVREGIPLRIP